MQAPRILVINLGGTTSKFALFDGDECLAEHTFPLPDELATAPLSEQRPERVEHLRAFLGEQGVGLNELAAVAARGGLMKPLPRRGVYRVDEEMLYDLASERFGSHPASLSSLIASDMLKSEGLSLPIYVVDPITIDTLWDEARVSGVPEVRRAGRLHALNVFRAVRHAAKQLKRPIHTCNFVVGHFGSGVSICTVAGGRCVDVNDAQLGEGPFSVSRAGTLPIRGVLELVKAEPDEQKLKQRLSRSVGLAAYTGTADFREIERRLDAGDPVAWEAYRAMVYQSVKYMAAYAGVLGGAPDAVVLTGGMIKSERFRTDLEDQLDWIAPVIVLPGEDEMAALAEGAYEAVLGLEPVLDYTEAEDPLAAPPRTMAEVVNRSAAGVDCQFVVAGAHHPQIAETVAYCHQNGISGFTLVGPRQEIEAQLAGLNVDTADVRIIDSDDVIADALDHIAMTPSSVLVKGKCDTAKLFHAVLSSLPHEGRPFLSHIAFVENPLSNKLVGITDGGINAELDLHKKIAIMENAIRTARALGVKRPRVALAAGMEDKGQDFPAIADAREIVRRHKAGEWPEAIIDGPFGVDIAIYNEAAVLKGIQTPIAGLADVIVTPSLESCNIGAKLMIGFTGRAWAGVVVGGRVPMVVGSRADDAQARLCSIAMAQLVATGTGNARPDDTVQHG
jgi:butyrate kinase